MPNYKAEVILTMNGKAVMPVLEAIKGKAEEIKQKMDGLTKNSAEWKQLNEQFKAFQSAEESIIKSSERLDHAVQNLASTSLQNLKKALGDGRRSLAGLSEEQLKEAEAIRKKMKIIGDEVRLLEGQYVKIEEGLKDINNQSNQWLDKAIKQQTELVNSLKKTDAEYEKQVQRLKTLRDEETRRAEVERAAEKDRAAIALKKQAREAERRANTGDYAGLSQNEIEAGKKAMVDYQKTLEFGSQRWQEYGEAIGRAEEKLNSFKQKQEAMTVQQARDLITNKDATSSQLREARSTIASARENTPTSNTTQITEFDKMLQQIDDRLDAVNGKVKKTEISWQQMRKVMADPKGAIGEDIKKTMDAIQQRIAKLPAGSRAVELLRAEYAKLDQTLKGTKKDVVDVNDVLKRSKQGKASVEELKQAYKQLEAELNKIKDLNGSAFKNGQKDLKNLKKLIDETTGSVNKQGGAFQTALRNIAAYGGVFTVFSKIKEMITGVIKKNLELSDSLADIRKVSGLAMQEINQMAVNLSKIDTRTTVAELNRIAYSGAKLGIGDMGVEALESFTRAANQVNVALKEDLGDEALTSLSKITQVMGLIPEMGVEQAMLRTGSAIFKLASTSTASSPKIIDFSNRLLSMGKQGALSTADILALGAAVDSMALEPEVASTAFNKMIVEIRKGTTSLESDLGIASGRLKELVESGKGMQAIQEIFQKMHESGNVFALENLFKDMGSEGGARMVKTMVTMADNVGILEKAVRNSNEAFQQGTAITEEYDIQQNTAQGILERANNLWEKAFINPEGVDNVKEMSKAWYDMSKFLTENEAAMGSLKISFDLILASVKLLIALLPGLIAAFSFKGVTAMLIGLKTALLGVGDAAIWTTLKTEGLRAAIARMNATMKANWLSVIIGLVVSAGVALYELTKKTKEADNAWGKFDKTLKKANEDIAVETANMKILNDQIKRTVEGTKARQAAIKTFNDKFGAYLSKLLTEKSTMQDVAKAYKEAAAAIREKVLMENKEEDLRKHYNPRIRWASGHLRDFDKASGGRGAWLAGWEEDMRGKELKWDANNAIVSQLVRETGATNVSGVLKALQLNQTALPKLNASSAFGQTQSTLNMMKFSKGDQALFAGLRYIAQSRSANNVLNDINRVYDIQGKPVGMAAPVDTGGGGGGGKHTGSTSHTGRNTRTGKQNNESAIAKDNANALLANIEAYYEEQARKFYEWVGEMNENGEKVSEGYIKEFMHNLEEHRLNAVGLARKSIATAGAEWDNFKSQLTEDQFQTVTETDTRLLKAIEASNVKELHDLFAKLGANLSKENNKTLSENLGALLDEIFKNGAKNLREAAENLVKRQQEIQKILNEHDYTGTVDRATRSKFDELRFLQPAKGVNEDTKEGQQKMSKAFDALTKKARESVVELYKIDPASKDFQKEFIDYLSVANDGFDFSMYKEEKHLEELKAFYIELIKYTDEYTEAEKRATDRRRKIIDREWSVEDRNVSTQQTIKEVGWRNDLRGKQPTLSESFGFYDIADDPEIKLYEYRKTAARDYYDFVKARTNDAILIREAEQKVLEATIEQVKKEWSAIQERVNAINGFMQPTYDAIEEMGNVWAKFNESAESGQQAMLDNLRNFIKQYAVMMIKGLRDQAERKVKGAILVKNTAEKNGMDVDELREASKQKKFRKKKVYNEDVSFNGKMNDDGTLDQEALKNSKGMGYVNAVGEDQQNPLNPVEAAEQVHALEIDELRSFHEQMLKEEALYREMMQKLQENPEAREQIISEYQDRIEQERKLNQEQSAIRKQGFDALKKVGVAGWNALLKQEGDAQQQKTDLATTAEEGITDTEKKNQDERAQQSAQASAQSIEGLMNETIAKVVLGIAGGSAKTIGDLGWWGIPLVGVISATLMGLLNYALSFIGKGSSSNAKAAPNTKLVSGMLTYDNGNIQDLKPFMGADGNIYYATEDNTAHRGVNLLTKPTATTINGQPSLVAENGPELVIGRETTAAMMQNNPALLKAIYQFDRNHSSRALYDAGNLAALSGAALADFGTRSAAATATVPDASPSGAQSARDEQMYALMAAILDRLNNPIAPEINMYGTNGLHRKIQQANAFMRGK